MTQIIDNPMVTGAGYYEPEPDFTCPTCGSQWWKEDINAYSVSAKRQYCGDCVDQIDTAENRQKWFVEMDANYPALATKCIIQQGSFGAKATINGGVNAKELVDWCKDKYTDGYEDVLYDYIHSNDVRRSEYRQWLMDTN